MKKLISLLLVLAMAMSLCTVVLAADGTVTYQPTTATSFNIKKEYTTTEENNVIPGEDLTFTVGTVDGHTNPDGSMITVGSANKYTVTSGDVAYDIPVNIPAYDTPGVYQYTIKEDAQKTAGMDYETEKTIYVTVFVTVADSSTLQLTVSYYITNDETNQKSEQLTNKYQTGQFTVKKEVYGDLANETDEFPVTVTLKSEYEVKTNISFAGTTVTPEEWTGTADEGYTYTKVLNIAAKDGKYTFDSIPLGVQVTVQEVDTGLYQLEYYTVDSGVQTKTVPQFEIASTDKYVDVVIANSWYSTPGTGVLLDNLPYILMLALVCGGALLLVRRRRAEF